VFAVVNTVLLRALPFATPDRLLWITSVRPDNPQAPFTLAEFMDYRSRVRTLFRTGRAGQLECHCLPEWRYGKASGRTDVGKLFRRFGRIGERRAAIARQ
jgi:hypothetical protein